MSLPLVAFALQDNELLALGAGALFVTVVVARGWAADAGRWGRTISHLRSENAALRQQNAALFERVQRLEEAARRSAEPKPPGDAPGPQAGGPGRTDGS